MTVGQLIEILGQFPKTWPVFINADEDLLHPSVQRRTVILNCKDDDAWSVFDEQAFNQYPEIFDGGPTNGVAIKPA